MTKVLVCGGRDFTDKKLVFETLTELSKVSYNPEIDDNFFMVIQGGAKGADRLAKEWALTGGYPMVEVPANWDFYGRSAGPIRNASMLKLEPDIVVAFPGGRGTQSMINLAEQEGIKVLEIEI